MEVERHINPVTARYRLHISDTQTYTLEQLAHDHKLHGEEPPIVKFHIPPADGVGSYQTMRQVAWSSYGLQLAPGASTKLAGKGRLASPHGACCNKLTVHVLV
jgi:hypothetical protein